MAVYTARMNTFYGLNTIIELTLNQTSQSESTNSTNFNYVLKIKRVNNWNDQFKGNAAIWFNIGGKQILDNKRTQWSIHGADHGHLINAESTLASGSISVPHEKDGTKTANISVLVDPNVSNAVDGAWDSREQMRIEERITLKTIPRPQPPTVKTPSSFYKISTLKQDVDKVARWKASETKKNVAGYGWMSHAIRANVPYKGGTLWSALRAHMDAPEMAGQRLIGKTATWDATWSESYDGDGNPIPVSNSLEKLQQGLSGNQGVRGSMVGFDFYSIQQILSNTRINKIELFLHLDRSKLSNGATASIGFHKSTAKPDEFSSETHITDVKFNKQGQGIWFEIPVIYGVMLATGDVTGFTLYKNSNQDSYSGVWSGYKDTYKPKIRISYDYPVGGLDFESGFDRIVNNTAKYIEVKTFLDMPHPYRLPTLSNITRYLMRNDMLPGDDSVYAEYDANLRKLMLLNGLTRTSYMLPSRKVRYN